jgi:hypothetical protein
VERMIADCCENASRILVKPFYLKIEKIDVTNINIKEHPV